MNDQMTKHQHYIPQFYLKNFLGNDKKLWVYDRKRNYYFPSYTENICQMNYLYEVKCSDTRVSTNGFINPNFIERDFAKNESEFASLMKKMIKLCSDPLNLNSTILLSIEKKLLNKFVLNMFLRNPWSLKQLYNENEIMDIVNHKELKDIRTQLNNDETFSAVAEHVLQLIWLSDYFSESIQSQLMLKISRLNFSVLKSPNYSFITSDFPIMYDLIDVHPDNTEFKSIFISISPNFAILYSCNECARRYRNRVIDLSDRRELVFKLNKWHTRQHMDISRFLFAQNKKALEEIIR